MRFALASWVLLLACLLACFGVPLAVVWAEEGGASSDSGGGEQKDAEKAKPKNCPEGGVTDENKASEGEKEGSEGGSEGGESGGSGISGDSAGDKEKSGSDECYYWKKQKGTGGKATQQAENGSQNGDSGDYSSVVTNGFGNDVMGKPIGMASSEEEAQAQMVERQARLEQEAAAASPWNQPADSIASVSGGAGTSGLTSAEQNFGFQAEGASDDGWNKPVDSVESLVGGDSYAMPAHNGGSDPMASMDGFDMGDAGPSKASTEPLSASDSRAAEAMINNSAQYARMDSDQTFYKDYKASLDRYGPFTEEEELNRQFVAQKAGEAAAEQDAFFNYGKVSAEHAQLMENDPAFKEGFQSVWGSDSTASEALQVDAKRYYEMQPEAQYQADREAYIEQNASVHEGAQDTDTSALAVREGSRRTGGFGPRAAPTPGASTWHKAVDEAAPAGSTVQALGNGVVQSSGWCGGHGNCTVVKHGTDEYGRTWYTKYNHLLTRGAESGTQLKEGDALGKVGSTGISTGNHLDLQVYYEDSSGNKVFVNPDTVWDRNTGQLKGGLAFASTEGYSGGLLAGGNTPSTTPSAATTTYGPASTYSSAPGYSGQGGVDSYGLVASGPNYSASSGNSGLLGGLASLLGFGNGNSASSAAGSNSGYTASAPPVVNTLTSAAPPVVTTGGTSAVVTPTTTVSRSTATSSAAKAASTAAKVSRLNSAAAVEASRVRGAEILLQKR